MVKYLIVTLLTLLSVGLVLPAIAEEAGVPLERASGEDLAAAIGHYARARSLLIEAIHEFDRGYQIADPDVLLDAGRWRGTLTERASELERVLDPQPRATKSGVKFNADKRLLNEAKDSKH